MNSDQIPVDGSKNVEIRMFFERTKDSEIFVDRIHVSKDTPQSEICDAVLYAWGNHPKIDDLTFMMAQTPDGSVIVTKPILLDYVKSYSHLYA
jgi:pyruvate/2-oxoglutarate dehydrogenase complex dihydrolipoamide dehydrogenase (E3) component